MSDSEDDFVEILHNSTSSDSDWEKICNSEDESLEELPATFIETHEPSERDTIDTRTLPVYKEQSIKPKRSHRRRRAKRRAPDFVLTEKERPHWEPLVLKQAKTITPDDPVEVLGFTDDDVSLLKLYSIATVGELASFSTTSLLSSNDKDCGRILDLQENACEVVATYVTRKTEKERVRWGYYYLREIDLTRVLEQGFINAQSLLFLWKPIPTDLYQNCLAIDRMIGKEANDPFICDRYSRLIKINLTTLCEYYEARLYTKEANVWHMINLNEVDAWAMREDMWSQFTPGNDVFASVSHGKLVMPTGQIPLTDLGCVEFDHPIAPSCMQEPEKEDEVEGDLPAWCKEMLPSFSSKQRAKLGIPKGFIW